MGKSKHVGNKHLYIGTSKNPKRMDTVSECDEPYIWKRDDSVLLNRLEEARKVMKEKDILKESKSKYTYELQSFSYTIFAKGRQGKYGNKL